MSNIERAIREKLFALQDAKYRDFQCRLIPTADPATVIGVRTPDLRRLAREVSKTPDAAAFLKILPHKYFEENNLHAFLIEQIKYYGQTVAALDAFLPYVDNWATCDQMQPKVFKKHLPELQEKIKEWVSSGHTYTVRFGVNMLMGHYLDEHFDPAYLRLVADIRSEEYYVNMMIAWFFATALAKQYEAALPFIERRCLDTWTHNKAIQKAIESCRISDEQKAYLRTLKTKTERKQL